MRQKLPLAFILSFIASTALTVSAQTWERTERDGKQKRKQTVVRTVQGSNGVIVTTDDEVIVRPALRPLRPVSPARPVRPIIVRPAVQPRPPVAPLVRANVRALERSNYSGNRNVTVYSSGDYENARYESNRYESNRYENVAQVARLNGYRDGVREGAKDARDGDRYDPFGEHAYKDGATGYISKYGNREAYQQVYRQSFVRGYKESFDRYLGYDKRNW